METQNQTKEIFDRIREESRIGCDTVHTSLGLILEEMQKVFTVEPGFDFRNKSFAAPFAAPSGQVILVGDRSLDAMAAYARVMVPGVQDPIAQCAFYADGRITETLEYISDMELKTRARMWFDSTSTRFVEMFKQKANDVQVQDAPSVEEAPVESPVEAPSEEEIPHVDAEVVSEG